MTTSQPAANPWLRIFLPFAVGYYLSYMLRSVNAVIAPELTRELGVSATDLGLMTSAYLIAFGAFQLPLGLLLDRYGPRRVEALLLLVAAVGTALFALGHNLAQLIVARALIGLGVSACLMAAFKSFSQWFPAERLPSLNAAIMTAAGLGALTASVPLGWALPVLGWRGAFFALTAVSLLAALAIYTTPDKPGEGHQENLSAQLQGMAQVFSSMEFWRFAPQNAFFNGGFMAMQGLWAVPWLMTVNGYSRENAASHLFLMGAAMMIGFLTVATLVTRLARRGIHPQTILVGGMAGGVLVGVLILLDAAPTEILWAATGALFSVGNLSYALVSRQFPPHLDGRVNTALNLMTFIGAFAVQWGFGATVDFLAGFGVAQENAYRGAFALLCMLQATTLIWFQIAGSVTRCRQKA